MTPQNPSLLSLIKSFIIVACVAARNVTALSSVSNFRSLLSIERFRVCLNTLDNTAPNGKLRAKYFDDFIRSYSDGKCDATMFVDLPSSLVALFNSVACSICSVDDDYYRSSSCCSEDYTYIDLSSISADQLKYLCSSVDEILGIVWTSPPLPAAVPTNVVALSESPSASPIVKRKPNIDTSNNDPRPTRVSIQKAPTASASTKQPTTETLSGNPSPSEVVNRKPNATTGSVLTKAPVQKAPTVSPRTKQPTPEPLSDNPPSEIANKKPTTTTDSVPTKKSVQKAPVESSAAPRSRPSREPVFLPAILSSNPTVSPKPKSSPILKPVLSPTNLKRPSASNPVLNKAPSAFETTILPLTLSFRTDGIDSNSFMTGTNPTNDNKDSLLQAAEVAIDSILKNSGTLAELTLVNVTSVEDTKCIYPPPESSATKCLYVDLEITLKKNPGVNSEALKDSIIKELGQHPISFSG